MTIPKWLLPVIAVVAALAVGVAAVLIGMQFASPPPASSYAGPPTMTVPVLAPVDESTSVLEEDAATASPTPEATDGGGDSGSADTSIPISDTVGEREIVEPELAPDPVDPETLHLIDLVGLAPGLLPDLGLLGLGDREDDPCAATDGSAPGDCPAGAPGTILLDGDLPPLWLTAGAFPVTGHDRDGLPARDLGPLTCDPEDAGDGEVGLRVRVTAPGTWDVAYWPVDDPGAQQHLAPLVASTAQTDTWMAETRPGGYPIIEHCALFTGLEPNTVYTAVVSGQDVLDREPGAATITFNSDGLPVHPGIRLQPIGDNLLVAVALHASNENVQVQASVVSPGTEPNCDPVGSSRSLLATLTTVDDVPVDAAERLTLRAADEFNQKYVVSYRVPEGATVLICARWFPDEGSVPPWESDLSTFDSIAIVQSPDHLTPRVELVGFTPRDSRSTDLTLHVSSPEGADCGRFRWQTDREALPITICDPFFLSDGTAGTDDGRLYDRGFPSDLVLSIDATLASGETSETTALLPAGAGGCVGTCTAPRPSVFTLATIGGAADIRVSWEQGLQNGRTDWEISAVLDIPHDAPRHDAPRIDPRVPWTIQYFGFTHQYAAARMTLPVDRESDYELTFYDTRTREIGVSCDDGSPLVATGHGTSTLLLDMNGVCLGSQYDIGLRVTDLDGNSSFWNHNSTVDTYWPANLLDVGGLPVEARYQVIYQTTSGRYLNEWNLTIDGVRQNLIGSGLRDSRCSPDGIYQANGTFDTNLREDTYISLDTVTDLASSSRDCGSQRTGDPYTEPQILARPTWEELTSPTGFEIYVPESNARIRVYFTPR